MKKLLFLLILLYIIAYIGSVMYKWIEEAKQPTFTESVFKKNIEWCEKHKRWCKRKE